MPYHAFVHDLAFFCIEVAATAAACRLARRCTDDDRHNFVLVMVVGVLHAVFAVIYTHAAG